MNEVPLRKKSNVVAYRRKLNLCEYCGRFDSSSIHECLENYVKSDMRNIELSEDDIYSKKEVSNVAIVQVTDAISVTDTVSTPPNDEIRIKTIKSYREKKGLCIFCGKNEHDSDCHPDYTESDMRSDEEKENDPRTVITPKIKVETVAEKIVTENFNDKFIENQTNRFYKLNKTADVMARPFIIVDISKSDKGQLITFDYVRFMAGKYKNMVIVLLGEPNKVFTFNELRSLEGLYNIMQLKNTLDQNVVNYLNCCKRMFGYPSKYITYCMTRNIPCTTFVNNNNGMFNDIPCDIVSLNDDESVTRETVMRNVVSWRL